MNILEADKLSVYYHDGTKAIEELSFAVEENSQLAVVGANGAGKTTLVNTIAGFLKPASGSLRVFGKDINKENLSEIRANSGFIFHNPDDQLFMPSVLEDVAFGLRSRGEEEASAERAAKEILDELQAGHLADRFPGHLSAGEKRLVCLAAVLVLKPQLLILDEPSSYLDPASRRELIDTLLTLKLTKIIITHDLELALELSDKALIMHAGRKVALDSAKVLFSQADLMRNYRLEVPYSLKALPSYLAST